METFEVVAHPHFSKADLAWLTDIRSRRADSRGAPYFTLVFSSAGLGKSAFVERVRKAAGDFPRIRFRLRSALVVPEARVKRFHVFLVPDEGFAAILRLHDQLHQGELEADLRLDSPYLPHITVATTPDAATARKLAFALNNGGIDIHGHIDALQIEGRDGERVRQVAEAPLKASWFG